MTYKSNSPGIRGSNSRVASIRAFGNKGTYFNPICSQNLAAYDPDAQAFFVAAGITDAGQKSAINTLVLSLKSYNIWTLFSALYPLIGGSSSSHAVNLKSPGTFDITWSGGLTHNANGVTGNGTNGYGATGYIPSTHGTLNSEHISFYCRTSGTSSTYEMGCIGGARTTLSCRDTDTNCYFSSQAAGDTSEAVSASTGLYIVNRTASNAINLWRAGTKEVDLTTASTSRPTTGIVLFARGSAGSPSGYSAKNGAFASIGIEFDDTQAANFSTAVQVYQTALSRNV